MIMNQHRKVRRGKENEAAHFPFLVRKIMDLPFAAFFRNGLVLLPPLPMTRKSTLKILQTCPLLIMSL